jgi:phytoene desaturase
LARLFSEKEVDAFKRFMQYSERIYALTSRIFLYTPIHELSRVLTLQNLATLVRIFQIDPFRTVHQGVSRFFSDSRLVQLFDRYATYNGSDPYQAPATLNIIPHVEFGIGGYYIRGGMYRLVETLTHLADEMGVRIHTRQRVQKILHTGTSVTGLCVDNQTLATDAVLCNSDVVTTFSSLIEGFPQVQRSLNTFEPSLSGLVFLWGINQTTPQWAHHNILFSSDYRREFKQIFTDRSMPDDPTIYISITSKTDPDHAPDGKENWFVLVNTPYLSENQDWDAWIQKTRERVLLKIKSVLGTSIADKIEVEETITPRDFLLKYGSNKGSIYGISSNSRTTAFRRPANRNRHLRGLYFAGGSAHPGGGIPLVLLSGKMAAELINQYQGV